MFLWSAKSTHFVSNLEKNREYATLGNTLRLFQHYIGGIFSIHYNITGGVGGLPNLLQYYNRGEGVYRDPKFVLHNKWTAP